VLLAALDAYVPEQVGTRQELERRAVAMLSARGAPLYEPNIRVWTPEREYEVDGLYAAERLVVELQSEAHHSTPEERRQDRVKANALNQAGFALLQWDWDDVTREPDATVRGLLGTLAQRSTSSTCAPPPSRRT
jgi:very-short-patch-repair endonuclease